MMRRRRPTNHTCPNSDCCLHGQPGRGNVVRHCRDRLTRAARRRPRYRCTACGATFASTRGSAYHRLQYPPELFDRVAELRVEGMSISAIARVTRLSWNTVARWLDRAAASATRFNDDTVRGFELVELQADELRTFIERKDRTTWVFAAIEVNSRLWPATIVGRRTYANTRSLVSDIAWRGEISEQLLVATDGFKYYAPVVRRQFGLACIFGQVVKKLRKNRVTRVERRVVIGTPRGLDDALSNSEDSSRLNTSFIERMNLTIRQGSAYLNRKTPCHARSEQRLTGHLELLRCHYNFLRRHRSLKFGAEYRTPGMQAGLVSQRLTFRDIFTARPVLVLTLFAAAEAENDRTWSEAA